MGVTDNQEVFLIRVRPERCGILDGEVALQAIGNREAFLQQRTARLSLGIRRTPGQSRGLVELLGVDKEVVEEATDDVV